ncbi:MAG: cupin domain-containing protein [Candidatus Moranbacteria bacterium]|nr:cupin domain-containing protein [Candidatus Moranbacteria bacterium]
MKKGYYGNIERLTTDNQDFRRVLYTAADCQLVLMSLLPGEEIGLEAHKEGDQFFRFEQGAGQLTIDGTTYTVTDGDAVIVPMGATHNVINTSPTEALKLYTIYAPPHHQDQLVRSTRAEAEASSPEFDGMTTEE